MTVAELKDSLAHWRRARLEAKPGTPERSRAYQMIVRRKAQIAKAERPVTVGWRSLRIVAPWLSPADAQTLAAALGPAFQRYDITTPKRAAAAVAQMCHESAGFRTTTEYASGSAYEGRRDLGNTHAGDGVRFKGRGYIQITGRNNYAAVSKAFGVDFVANPQQLASPKWAAMASCWWWQAHGCNQLADSGDFVALTRRINGGTNGLADRQQYWSRARKVARFLVPRQR
jgi:predicted chitinase